ncbi:MAG: glycosyltransferase [Thermoanaerobaculia bacterium]
MNDVSVIVLDIDGGPMLQRCLHSILAQTLTPDEIVVLDNGSQSPVSATGARVMRSEVNLGFAEGVNRAARTIRSEFVAVVNNDVTLDSTWLAAVIAAMHADGGLGAVQTLIRRDDQVLDGAGIAIADGTFQQIGHNASLNDGALRSMAAGAWGVSATAALYRRAAVGDPMFDSRFFAYYEDVELSARMHERGWRTVVLDVPLARHEGSKSAGVLRGQALRLRTRNRYWVTRLHPGVGLIPALMREDLRLLLRGRTSLRGMAQGLFGKIGERSADATQADRPPSASASTNTIVIHTSDVVGERMAGPGIRAWHIASELARHFPTILIARREGALPAAVAFPVLEWGTPAGKKAIAAASVLIGQPARGFRRVRPGQRLVADLFDPVLLELRELYGASPSPRQRIHLLAERFRIWRALREADLLLVAFGRQRELYGKSRAPIMEVPFGAEAGEVDSSTGDPARDQRFAAEHGSLTITAEGGPLILWGGGTWEWLDPATAVAAVVAANTTGTPCRLLFLGRSRPNAQTGGRLREDRLDVLLERGAPYVTANAEWIPYAERLWWLRQARIAIMLHRPTAEATYSIRTRLFDAMAAGVPVIATEGGFAAGLVAEEGLGVVVPPDDVDAVHQAITRLITDDAFHASCVTALARVRTRFAWPVVMAPLIEVLTQWQKQES